MFMTHIISEHLVAPLGTLLQLVMELFFKDMRPIIIASIIAAGHVQHLSSVSSETHLSHFYEQPILLVSQEHTEHISGVSTHTFGQHETIFKIKPRSFASSDAEVTLLACSWLAG